MKSHDRILGQGLCASTPSAQGCAVASTIPGDRDLTYPLPIPARFNAKSSPSKPCCSEACSYCSVWGTQYNYALQEGARAHSTRWRPTSIACYFTHPNNCHGLDWSLANLFFFFFFFKIYIRSVAGVMTTCTPLHALSLTIDVDRKFTPPFALGLGLARPQEMAATLSETSPLSAQVPTTSLINAARSPSIVFASVYHPIPCLFLSDRTTAQFR